MQFEPGLYEDVFVGSRSEKCQCRIQVGFGSICVVLINDDQFNQMQMIHSG